METPKANINNSFEYLCYILSKTTTFRTNIDWNQLMLGIVDKEDLKKLHEILNKAKVDPQRIEDFVIRGAH